MLYQNIIIIFVETFRTEGRQDNRATKIMKTTDGYTLRKSYDCSYQFEVHKFTVDACTAQGDPDAGLWDRECVKHYANLKDAKKYVMAHKDKADMFEIWDEWYTCNLNTFGDAVEGDLVSQTVYSYVKGKLINKDTLL